MKVASSYFYFKARFKLPRELPFDGQAKGNGMTLGLTNGTTNFALGGYSGNTTPLTKPSAFNTNVNATDASIGSITLGNYGVTTDQTKSGIILNRDNTKSVKYLFFFIN